MIGGGIGGLKLQDGEQETPDYLTYT